MCDYLNDINSIMLFLFFLFPKGGEGSKNSLHIPRVYFKRFLPVSNLVGTDGILYYWPQLFKEQITLSSR